MGKQGVKNIVYNSVNLNVWFTYNRNPVTKFNETEINDIRVKSESIINLFSVYQINEIKNLI